VDGKPWENHRKTIGKWRFTLWYTNSLLLKMVMEIVDFPSYKMVDLSIVM